MHSMWNAMKITNIWCPDCPATPKDYAERSEWGDGTIRYFVQFGIPMFFYISGMTGAHYNVEKRGFLQYLVAKIKRLAIPFVIAYVFILIPRLYLAQNYELMGQVYKDCNDHTLPECFGKDHTCNPNG